MQRVVNVSPSRPRPLPGSALLSHYKYLQANKEDDEDKKEALDDGVARQRL